MKTQSAHNRFTHTMKHHHPMLRATKTSKATLFHPVHRGAAMPSFDAGMAAILGLALLGSRRSAKR